MTTVLKSCLAPLPAAFLLLFSAFVSGCGKPQSPEKPSPSAADDRRKDAVYQKQLSEIVHERNGLAGRNADNVAAMKKVVAAARANLPKDATEAAVEAELDGHPERYPEWKNLKVAIAADNAAMAEQQKKARDVVRARILKEAAANRQAAPVQKK